MSAGAQPKQTPANQEAFIAELSKDTWTYLSSDWARTNHLPWSWRSETLEGGDFANSAEIGLFALSWLAAYEMGESWSPSWSETETEILAILEQLRQWQTGSQQSQPNGANAYLNGPFYQWYWISWNPPVVGANVGTNQIVPSIDNAWLVASLITIREYAETHNHLMLAERSDAILQDIDLTAWYNESNNRFYLGEVDNPKAGIEGDYYSNENRLINFVARAQGDLTSAQLQDSLIALEGPTKSYDGIVVEKVAWDGSLFTYLAPALFMREDETDYGTETLIPAVQAQIKYAENQGYSAWGFSDCFDHGTGGYIQQGAPPAATSDPLEANPGMVTPSVGALALLTPLATKAITNLQTLATDFPAIYDQNYGFRDCVMVNQADSNYRSPSDRFSSLAQLWLFLAIANYQSDFIHDYFYLDQGVHQAHLEMFGQPPALLHTAPRKGMWVWQSNVVTDSAERAKLIAFAQFKGVDVVYLHAPSLLPDQSGKLAEFVMALAGHQIEVELLAGDPSWALEENHQTAVDFLIGEVTFARTLPAEVTPPAIHFDIEPYLLSQWGADRDQVAGEFLDLLVKLNMALDDNHSNLDLVLDIPFWFDTVEVTFQEVTKPLNQHIQDQTDRIVILDYRDFAQGTDGILFHAENELAYGTAVGKRVVIGLETNDIAPEPEKVTFFEEGESVLNEEIEKVKNDLQADEHFGGISIHDYLGYQALSDESKFFFIYSPIINH